MDDLLGSKLWAKPVQFRTNLQGWTVKTSYQQLQDLCSSSLCAGGSPGEQQRRSYQHVFIWSLSNQLESSWNWQDLNTLVSEYKLSAIRSEGNRRVWALLPFNTNQFKGSYVRGNQPERAANDPSWNNLSARVNNIV